MLGEHVERAGAENLGVELAIVDRVERGARFEIFEAVAGDDDALARLVEPVVGAADPLQQARAALGRAHLDDEIDVAPVDAEVEAGGGDQRWNATASLDLGVDWGDVDLVVQMGRAQGLVAPDAADRPGQPPARRASEAIIVPGNRFEYLEARAALDAIEEGELDPEISVPARSTCSPSTSWRWPGRAVPQDELLAEVRSAAPYAGLKAETFRGNPLLHRDGGYALKAYDRFKRIVPEPGGLWRVSARLRPAAPDERGDHRRQPLSTSASGTAGCSARSRTVMPRP